MADIGMVGKILWEDYYKIAWVNILTGEYQFVKILDTDEEKPCLAAKDIYEYSRLVVSTGLVPEEAPATPEELLKDFSLERFRDGLPDLVQIPWRS